MARVDFTVTPSAGVQGFWIAVDDQDVRLVNGRGSIDLPAGKHTLIWWFAGDEGDSIAIVGMQGARTAVQVKKSQIPSGDHREAGVKKFDIV